MEHKCYWECGYVYEDFNTETEFVHLQRCIAYRNRPVVQIREDGKKFVESLHNAHILVELIPLLN